MIESTSNKTARFEGNNATTEFSFTFRVDDEADIVVSKYVGGVETTLTLTTNYTVTLTGETGGHIDVSGTPLAPGEFLVISRVLDILQETDLENQGGFFPSTVELSLDEITMILQQHDEALTRCPKADISSGESGADWWAEMVTFKDEAAASAAAAAGSASIASTQAANAIAAAIEAASYKGNAQASEAAALASAQIAAAAAVTAQEQVETVTTETEGKTLLAADHIIFCNNAVDIEMTLGLEEESMNRKHTILANGAGDVDLVSATLNETVPSGASFTVACNGIVWRII